MYVACQHKVSQSAVERWTNSNIIVCELFENGVGWYIDDKASVAAATVPISCIKMFIS